MNKLIVLDLDGTLLRSDKTVSNKSISVLKECEKAGCKIVIATARPPRVAYNFIPEELTSEYAVCYNGAEIYKNQQKIHSQYICENSVKLLVDFFQIKYPKAKVSLEINNKLYSNYNIEKLFGNNGYELVDYSEMTFKPTAKVLVNLSCVSSLENIIENIPQDCSMVITDEGSLGQIMAKGVSKLEAIRYILNEWKMEMDDIVAFGDDFNDIDIIKHSGVGVAMGNAVSDLKDVAKYVTKTNDEDGVAFFLEEMLLNSHL
jgi:Cof subfamily protein (haloacid dehalogenase superfamily)